MRERVLKNILSVKSKYMVIMERGEKIKASITVSK